MSFHATHAYPGCAATLVDAPWHRGRRGVTIAEFRDGSAVSATYERVAADEIVLRVGAYTTARHTPIAARTWKLVRARLGDFWKVKARLDRGR